MFLPEITIVTVLLLTMSLFSNLSYNRFFNLLKKVEIMTHTLYENNPYIDINLDELKMSLNEVNQLSSEKVVKLSAVVVGMHNGLSFGEEWLIKNGRHYIMQQIFKNAGLDFQKVDKLIDVLIEEKGKIGDEDILQYHPLLFDFLLHYNKSITRYMKDRHKLRKYKDYEPSKYQVLKFSKLGMEFEHIVEKVLEKSNLPFTKYNSGIRGCKPDFIISSTHWLDAKLSEHTVFNSETITKYEKHVEKLTIVYLRKTSQLEWRRFVTPKTELVHISFLLKDLPIEERTYFEEELNKLEKSIIKALI